MPRRKRVIDAEADRGKAERLRWNAAIHARWVERLREEVARRELTYYRIAKDTGLSTAALSRFRQRGTLSVPNLCVLADYLGFVLAQR